MARHHMQQVLADKPAAAVDKGKGKGKGFVPSPFKGKGKGKATPTVFCCKQFLKDGTCDKPPGTCDRPHLSKEAYEKKLAELKEKMKAAKGKGKGKGKEDSK